MKRRIRSTPLIFKIILSALVLLATIYVPASAESLTPNSFMIEAGSIQGVLLPPKIVFVNTASAHPVPAVVFQYKAATITDMTLIKQLNTGKGPVYIKISSQHPLHVQDLKVVATSFSFGGACLDPSQLSQAIVMKDVKMAATEMTSEEMDTQGIQLDTRSGVASVSKPARPHFLNEIMNENSLSAMEKLAEKMNVMSLLFQCTGTGTSPSGQSASGWLPKTPSDLKTKVTDPISKVVTGTEKITDPIGKVVTGTKKVTDPITQPIQKITNQTTDSVTKVVKKTSSTVQSVVKKTVQDTTKQVTSVVKTGTDTVQSVVKTGENSVSAASQTTSSVISNVSQLSQQLQNQIQSGLDQTNSLNSQITDLQNSEDQLSQSVTKVQSLLDNPLNLLGGTLHIVQQISQLQNTLTQLEDQQKKLDSQIKALEKNQNAVQKQIDQNQLGTKLSTKDWETKLSKAKKDILNLGNDLQNLQTLLGQLSP